MKKALLILVLISVIPLVGKSQSKAKFYTTEGDFILYLEDTLSPITAGNFIALVNQKYYDGVIFHRVIDNFMIQGGRGATKPAIQDEFITGLSNVQGSISMANTGQPNSGTTQFFINLVDNTRLDWDKAPSTSKHPVFGHIIEGFSVVQKIGKVPKNGSTPITDVVMDSVRLIIPGPATSVSPVSTIKNDFQFYPNPAQNSISVSARTTDAFTIEIVDLTGKVILRKELVENGVFDISSLNEGFYIIRANQSGTYFAKRLVIKR
jgi:peptidylprolyl isomerase